MVLVAGTQHSLIWKHLSFASHTHSRLHTHFGSICRVSLIISGISVEEGVRTQLWAATSPEAKSGMIYVPIGKEDDGGAIGSDQKLIDELWDRTD